MARRKPLVSEERSYLVRTVADAKSITQEWLAVQASKIGDDYERTNVWRIQPATNSPHPAAFPLELAEKVIRYYSFKGDVVMDPFAGSGTVGAAAARLGRRFVLFEINPQYVDIIRNAVGRWLGRAADDILWLNCEPAPAFTGLFDYREDYAAG